MSPENKAHFLIEKEAIHLILTGIGDDIYSTVDACQTAHEMWEAIERLQQGQRLISSTTSAGMVKNVSRMKIERDELDVVFWIRSLAGSESHPSMLNKENYVPWSSRLLRLHKDIYAAVDSCETAKEIWLRVQQMMKISDIEIQEKKAKQMQMVGGNGGNQFRQYAVQNARNLTGYNDVIGNQGSRSLCYAAYLQTQLLIAHKEEAGIQLQAKEYDLMGAAADLDEIKEVNVNCILMANLQQASTSGNTNQNQIGNGNLMAVRAEGNAAGQNGNQIRCYNCTGV
nr:hypothetical protein [Tanacetum cinerariifolium]